MKQPFLLMLFSVSTCFGASQFVLDAELQTNIVDNNSTTRFLTGYTYDTDGNRIQSRVWEGADSIQSPLSSVKFTYNENGDVIEAIHITGTDTSSIIRYTYDNKKLLAIYTFNKNGILRFSDTLIYDNQGRNVENQRISSAGIKTFFHRYTLNEQGMKLSDTLFELVTTSFIASQALIYVYNTDSTVSTETHWRLNGSIWYCISTAFMSYSAGTLVSVARHERDGAGTAMIDSLAYTYDQFGNRIIEEDYDGNKALTHQIVYTWRDTQPVVVLNHKKSSIYQWPALSNKQDGLSVNLSSYGRGTITVFDISGRQLSQITVDHSGILPLNGLFTKGSYLAVFSSNGIKRQTLKFTIYN